MEGRGGEWGRKEGRPKVDLKNVSIVPAHFI